MSNKKQLSAKIDQLTNQINHLKASLDAAKKGWPEKCPITRRDFFMEIDGVPTYGGPFDSYTIPEMLGTPDQPWHERELFVRRFDHDRGHWVDDEIINLRVIYDGVLDDLLDCKESAHAVPEGWRLVPFEPSEGQWGELARAIVFWMRSYPSNQHTPSTLLEFMSSMGHAAPDWLKAEPEMLSENHVISKGTVAALIYKAMLSAAPKPGSQS